MILGGVLTAILALTQTYRTLTSLKLTATVVKTWTQPRYNSQTEHVDNEYCLELAYEVNAQSRRSNYCSWNDYSQPQELLVRVDPKRPDEATPVESSDMMMTLLKWTLLPGMCWMLLVFYGYEPLYDYVEERRRKRRQDKRRGKKGKQNQP